jgi:nucleoside-specific outer membrane channel protein Tsx
MPVVALRAIPCALCTALLLLPLAPAGAAEWSDSSISWRYGQDFREPFNPEHLRKHIVALTYADGDSWGGNYFNADYLMSDSSDPRRLGGSAGARETYIVYRRSFDIGKITGKTMQFGPVRGVAATVGFDWNHKADVGYNSRKRMLVAGPTLMWDVPGFLNTSLLLLHESNAPSGAFPPISNVSGRYTYDVHPMLNLAWGIAVSPSASFEGFANFIASKGDSEVGAKTGAETNIDMALMFDVGPSLGLSKKGLRIGLAYQYWNNKFGNTSATTGGQGYRATTPMVRVDMHF